MFSNNGKISNHQTVRLLILDIFTGACLFLPMALPKVAGYGGWAALVGGILFTWLNGIFLTKCMKNVQGAYVDTFGNGLIGAGMRWLYGIRCFAVYVFLMGMLSSVLNETFLYSMPKWLILAGMTVVVVYGAVQGIEVRARLSEIFFYVILIPIITIGLFSLPEAEWGQLAIMSDVAFEKMVQGGMVTWVLMAPTEWILYIVVDHSQGNTRRIFRWVFRIGGGLILLIYLLCVVVLGTHGMSGERWPTVILMQIVKIPGGFLSRQDGLMLSFWIFAMFISLSGALSHASSLWSLKKRQSNLWKSLLLAIVGSTLAYFTAMNRWALNIYFYFMIISGVLLLWIVPALRLLFKKKMLKRAGCVTSILLLCIGIFTGCEYYVELENRQFIMAIGVDKGNEQSYAFTYAFPDLSALTGNGNEGKKVPITIEANSLTEAENKYNHMSDKVMDYGQVKVLVLGPSLCNDKQALKLLINEMRYKSEVARTIFVCRSVGEAKSMIEMDEGLDYSVGIYLEKLFENNECEIIFNDFLQNLDEKKLPKIRMNVDRIQVVS